MCSNKSKLVIVEFHNDRHAGGFYTTPLFWDCECEEEYIHPATHTDCCACGAVREEAPDARVDEVLRQAGSLGLERLTVLDFLRELDAQVRPMPFAPEPPRPIEDAWLETAYEDRCDAGDW